MALTTELNHGAARRVRHIHDRLLRTYGPQRWWPAETPIEVVVGAYLTQNTSWRSVERSLRNMRSAKALSMDGLRAIAIEDLQILIRPSGFYTRKATALKAFIGMLDSEFEGSLESLAAQPTENLREKLLSLPSVGPETADVILLYALKHPVPVADEYFRRIAGRHGLTAAVPERNRKGYEVLTRLTRQAFSNEPLRSKIQIFNEFHALTVAVGKAHCGRKPDCRDCPLASDLGEKVGMLDNEIELAPMPGRSKGKILPNKKYTTEKNLHT